MSVMFVRSIWVIFKKDLRVWWRNPLNIVASLLPVLTILLINGLGTAAVGRAPVALVTLDHGPKGQQMQQIFHQADLFRITDTTPKLAQAELQNVEVAAVITIPADFTKQVAAHAPSPVEVTVNNLNLDIANDIRRAVPDVITQFYQAQGSKSPIKVTLHEQDLRKRDVTQFQYNVVPMLVMLLLVSGLLNSSTAAAREWETRTIKELLLAPVARSAIIIGKVLAGFIATMLLGLLVFGLSAALDWTRPAGWQWVPSLLMLALIALLGTGLGVAFGAAVQRLVAAIPFSILVAFYLFFLAGGIGVLAFDPTWLQNIAAYDPLAYGVHALSQAVFYRTSDVFGRDVLVLGLGAVVALVLGVIAMRRGIAS